MQLKEEWIQGRRETALHLCTFLSTFMNTSGTLEYLLTHLPQVFLYSGKGGIL
jgi:hypothetical protein